MKFSPCEITLLVTVGSLAAVLSLAMLCMAMKYYGDYIITVDQLAEITARVGIALSIPIAMGLGFTIGCRKRGDRHDN
jgi:hypothetical protein